MTDLPSSKKRQREQNGNNGNNLKRVLKKFRAGTLDRKEISNLSTDVFLLLFSNINTKNIEYFVYKDIFFEIASNFHSNVLRTMRGIGRMKDGDVVTLIGALFWDFTFWKTKIRKDFPLFKDWLDHFIDYRENINKSLKINIETLKKREENTPISDISVLYFWIVYFYDFIKNRFIFFPDSLKIPYGIFPPGEDALAKPRHLKMIQVKFAFHNSKPIKIIHNAPTIITLYFSTMAPILSSDEQIRIWRSAETKKEDILIKGYFLIRGMGYPMMNENNLLVNTERYTKFAIESIDKKTNLKIPFQNVLKTSYIHKLLQWTEIKNIDQDVPSKYFDIKKINNFTQIPFFTTGKTPTYPFHLGKLEFTALDDNPNSIVSLYITQDVDRTLKMFRSKKKKWFRNFTHILEPLSTKIKDLYEELTIIKGEIPIHLKRMEIRLTIIELFLFGPDWHWDDKVYIKNEEIEMDTLFEIGHGVKSKLEEKFEKVDLAISIGLIGKTKNIKLTSCIDDHLYCHNCLKLFDYHRLNAKICSRCKNIYYCSNNCQKEHWSSHKDECEKKEV